MKIRFKSLLPLLALCVFLLAGCGSGEKGAGEAKGIKGYEGYWFILAELDENGEEIKFYGNTRFHLSLPADGSAEIYAERYNYDKKIWYEREDVLPGFTYTYDKEADLLTLEKNGEPTVTLQKAAYKGSDAVEMFPDNSKEKTILTRENPKPK
ncbi:MAG: hypothetical protein PHD67_08015 [Oscillospiraceae bacterium]|nr:hypothetical protein [Oscillospiraceae bacterium]